MRALIRRTPMAIKYIFEYEKIWRFFANKFELAIDESCKDTARFYFKSSEVYGSNKFYNTFSADEILNFEPNIKNI